jgi:N-acetylneuraminic acid mutarotase
MFESTSEMRLRVLLVAGLIAVTSFGFVSARAAAQGTSVFTTIDVTGAGTGAMQGTVALGIDTAGDVTGTYLDANRVAHGFVRAANGTITTFDAPGAGAAPLPSRINNPVGSPYFQGTVPTGINSSGGIAGLYIDANWDYHGFVRAANGAITEFDVPGALTGAGPSITGLGTRPIGINDAGTIVGTYVSLSNSTTTYDGFVRAASGAITTFDTPGGGGQTIPICINAAGDVAGTYLNYATNSLAPAHGFIRSASGTITEFDVSGAGGNANNWQLAGSVAIGIDASGDVVGAYTDTSTTRHGFFRSASGTISTFDAPGAATGWLNIRAAGGALAGTAEIGINSAGNIAGAYLDADAVYHGFVRAVSGGITTFDAPNAGTGTLQGTVGFSINTTGTIAGTYLDANYVAHGFIYTPPLATTTTQLGSSPNPSFYKEPVTFTAQVEATSTGSAPPDGETVSFVNGTTTLGTGTLSGGMASFTTTALPVGTDLITAVYTGDSNYAGSTSLTYNQTVGKANSYTTLTSSLNPSSFGQSVTLTTSVSGQFGGTVTGTVTFSNGSTSLGSVSLSGNSAGLTTTVLPSGTDSITAVYNGDTNFAGSTSNTVSQVVTAQSSAANEWTWEGGSSSVGTGGAQPGVYGTLVVPAAGNIPGGRDYPVSWTDSGGNFWLFGGQGVDGNDQEGVLNDLWVFYPSTGEWAWMSGSNSVGASLVQPGVYGTLGTPATGNVPGGRWYASSWTDKSGNLWLFGGLGSDASGTIGWLNDLWSFNPSSNLWTWVSGSSTVPGPSGSSGRSGVYGTLRVPAAGNVPGGRELATSWTDQNGNLWLFGGNGFDANGARGILNDLWEFNPSANEWTWMGGSNAGGSSLQAGVYGTLGVSAAGNIPGGRYEASAWADGGGNLWLFGGYGYDADSLDGSLNDLWRFSTSTNQWVWVGGSSTLPFTTSRGISGVYGTLGTPASGNIPGGRLSAASWIDHSGNLWLFGGYGSDASGNGGHLNDLWEFNPSSNQWAWISGSSTVPNNSGLPGVYGALGVPSAGNVPGGRVNLANWEDRNGNLWLFGGAGFDANGKSGYLNDLWQYQPSTTSLSQAATPTLNVPTGTYTTTQTVTISDATPNTTIYYTTNGSTPTTSSSVYSGAITVSSTETLEAIATASGYSTSAVASAAYTITPPAATPTFSPAAGSYTSAQTVTISDKTPGATIYYTTNGTTPTTSSTVYNGAAIIVSSSETLEAIATLSGYSNSAVASAGYLISPLAVGGMLDWTWMGGSSTVNHAGVYGTLGTPAAGNIPGSRGYATSWTDSSGNRWLFGGWGFDASGNGGGLLNDLWEFNPSTNEWTWIGGSKTLGSDYYQPDGAYGTSGVYGTLGTPAPGNIPGARYYASSWTDSSGHLWLFGGLGFDANGNGGRLNDLWVFNPSTNQWAWMGGSNTINQSGVYGTLGTPAAGNIPGARYEASSWTDGSGHLWLFGGFGYGASGTLSYLNDLWEFNPSTNQWAWMGGSNANGYSGVYGTMGTPAAGNIPGGRYAATSWTDGSGHLWLFGGNGYGANGNQGGLNDLWEFSPSTNQWAWMGGSSTYGSYGVYGTLGTPAAGNIPGYRTSAVSWTDSSGHLWLFGGIGPGASGAQGYLNDIWEFSPSTNQWAWMGGSSTVPSYDVGQSGVYGTLGTPAAANIPGGRFVASSWTDGSGHLWLFGGQGYDANGNVGFLNDLWEYQLPSQLPTATPTVTVTPSLTSITTMQGMTITVVVGEFGSQTPTGSVVLTGGGYTSAAATLSSGSAAFNLAPGSLSVGSYTFTASYTPDSTSSATYNSATGTSSAVTVALPVTATPVFSVPAGSYSSTQTVTISDATAGATIYYTTNGTTPTTSSTKYTGVITVSSSETLEAIAALSGNTNSAVASAGYLISPLAVGGMLDWTWKGGSNTVNHNGVYGTLGTPAAGNIPGSRYDATSWTDSSGNRWLFGGYGYGATGNSGYLNDLWELNPSSNQWAWMGGSSTLNQSGVYGTLGTFGTGNIPGGRADAVSWTDSNGNLWLFGGFGFGASSNFGYLNDLWMFNPSTNQWAWMGGSSTLPSYDVGQSGVYGTLGTPAAGNIPGGRYGVSSWTDSSGHLWLFGGVGYDVNGAGGWLNDLWEFDPSTNQWTWMGGSSTVNQSGVYGTLGTPATGNIPGSRYGDVTWTDISGNRWFFGGGGYDANGNVGLLNDLWEFNPSTNQWAWMGGSSTVNQSGVYGTPGTPAAGNVPGGNEWATTWTDSGGHLWLFGGNGYDANGNGGYLNDLWEFNPSTNQWAWMGGSSTVVSKGVGQPGVYGTLGTPVAGNIPGGRQDASSWTDGSGHLWLFGGNGYDTNGTLGYLNDLWEYQLPTTTPTVTVTPSLTSITASQGLSVTVAVSAGSDNRIPTGSVILTGTGGFATNSTALSSGSAIINIPAGLLAVGSDIFTASYTPDSSSSSIYNSATGTSSAVTVSPVTPTITWATPAAITYGSALSATQLDASSTVAGTFAYTPAAGTVLTAGAHTLSVTLTPTDTTDYTTATSTVTQTVNQATPTITWATPSPITYGTALSATQLNATSTVAGTFAYTPASGTVLTAGSHTLSVTLTPTDTTDYTTATSTVTQTVNQATPTITWATPAAITYGTALSATQLDATSTVAGTFAYTPAAGSVPNTGAQTLSVTLTPTDTTDYTTATATVQLTVSKAAPAITWPTPAAVTYGTALSATQLNASSTVAGTFAYTPASGTVLTAGAHTLSVTLTPTDTTDYTTATSTVTQTVNQATPTITWATPAAITYGTALSATQLDATASVPGTFVYSPAAGTTPAVGSDTLSVTFTPTDATDYTTATASVTLVVTSPLNPVPVVSSISPAFTDAGGAMFTLTVNGSGFIASSTVYWGASALATTYVSATQLTAQVPAADIANAGTNTITVQTPIPGGGTSNAWQFEVDSASGTTTGPVFTSSTATVAAGSTASYPVTLSSGVTSVTVTCLNLPPGATCSYSTTTNTVTIGTSSTTPAGTYQITAVFTETVSGTAAFILLPILLLPLVFLRRKLAARGVWITACLGLVLLAGAAVACVGCGGGGGGSSSTPPPQTQQVVSSGTVTLTVQ